MQANNQVFETVRARFDTINAELIRVSIITFDIAGTRALAQHAPNGVYSMVSKELRAKGNPALRKKLEHNVQVS